MKIKSTAAIALALFALATSAAQAVSVTADMGVQIEIKNACAFTTAPAALDFVTAGPLLANVDVTTTFGVTCTTGALYNIGMSGGSSNDVASRTMLNGDESVAYQLYSDVGLTTIWGNTPGTDTLGSTGTGTAETITVYGRVPPQTTPPEGTYSDTVVVSVNY